MCREDAGMDEETYKTLFYAVLFVLIVSLAINAVLVMGLPVR